MTHFMGRMDTKKGIEDRCFWCFHLDFSTFILASSFGRVLSSAARFIPRLVILLRVFEDFMLALYLRFVDGACFGRLR